MIIHVFENINGLALIIADMVREKYRNYDILRILIKRMFLKMWTKKMSEKFDIAQSVARQEGREEPAVPTVFRSSEGRDWGGLVVQATNEPRNLEGWLDPVIPDTSLVLVLRGAMYMEPHSLWKGQPIRQGDLFLKPGGNGPYELNWRCLSPEPLQMLHLQLNNDMFARIADEVTGRDLARLELIARPGFQDPLLKQIGFAIWQELEQDTPGGKLYVQTAAQMLAVHLLRHYTEPAKNIKELDEATQKLTRRQIKLVTDFMLAHMSQDLSLDMLAQQIGFSAYHFARLFRQTMGESPHQFVLRLRGEQAQRLLKETDEPLAQIALECGFANQSHLTLVFKRQFGVTPRTYRQHCQV
jgi:AraC family transcriptional regulator